MESRRTTPKYVGEFQEEAKDYVVKIKVDVHSVLKPTRQSVVAVKFINGTADILSTLEQEGYDEATIKDMEIYEITKATPCWEAIEAHFEKPSPEDYEPILGCVEEV